MAIPRCEAIPLDGHRVSFRIDGQERTCWHFGADYPRPFFYPFIGPAGSTLTRMGHPGAPDHDHHRSIWFAHNKVSGVDFWAEGKPPRIKQKEWLCYEDTDTEARMAVRLGWYDGHDPKELMQQELIVAVREHPTDTGTLLELQTRFTPTATTLTLGKTNFGFLAVRMAKSIAHAFGGGHLTSAALDRDEAAIFGKANPWIDYSGPVRPDTFNGITFYDHPSNPGHPTPWHVRDDGWMGASCCFQNERIITKAEPLTLRYLLWGHAGELQPPAAAGVAKTFGESKPFTIARATEKHVRWALARES
jgi:hypothetical protein